ncbi:MAG: hypothetical protein EZS28_006497 [Streblomastix strix]|uniref:Uncharacterized protein n=1 Tax=Streblomastix strix TaxID=222440 RepID=A0A5J4WSR5_9EUKA|nr:MAG: hypothetical protein EZS28_006497 [Streblomastix strix]
MLQQHFGAATVGGNAITDISIDGNTLTPAKNTIFVITGFDQFITEMKTFTSTIISNGIQYQGYDNNSVFLAGGVVRLFGNIQSALYTKLEDDTLLVLKDETQDPVINTYLTMSEVDVKLTNVVTINTTQSVTGTKTFNANVCAIGFVKVSKNETPVLQQVVEDDRAVATYIFSPNHTIDKGGYVMITHSTGLINCKSTSNTYIQCVSATWVK